jgi:GNAT superfamily N-acetyltransferase
VFGLSGETEDTLMGFAVSDNGERHVFESIFTALDGASREVIGPAEPRLLVIPIRSDSGTVTGGLWGVTLFRWLEVEMLFVPRPMRGRGVGSALMAAAETEARDRGCLGVRVDAFSFQAGQFYAKIGFSLFGTLEDCPPGHQRLFFQKRLT